MDQNGYLLGVGHYSRSRTTEPLHEIETVRRTNESNDYRIGLDSWCVLGVCDDVVYPLDLC